jgi:hypothetical protein
VALDNDECIEILRECGSLPNGPHFAAVNLLRVPGGLNADELGSFLREHGPEICGARGVTKPSEDGHAE